MGKMANSNTFHWLQGGYSLPVNLQSQQRDTRGDILMVVYATLDDFPLAVCYPSRGIEWSEFL